MNCYDIPDLSIFFEQRFGYIKKKKVKKGRRAQELTQQNI
jgi:hypothetical protein